MIDSSDRDRLDYAKDEIERTLGSSELESVPVLVIANKQDLSGAMKTQEITDKLDLHKLKRKWCK